MVVMVIVAAILSCYYVTGYLHAVTNSYNHSTRQTLEIHQILTAITPIYRRGNRAFEKVIAKVAQVERDLEPGL